MEFFTDTNEYKFCNGTEWVVQGGGEGAADCEDDDTATCTLDATRSNSDPDFIAANIAPGVTILGITGTYTPDYEPNAFSFTNQTGVSRGSTISSNAITLADFDGPLNATCGSGCTAIARNGTWGGTTVTGFMPGDTIAIRQISSSNVSTATTATVTVGETTSGTWSVTTSECGATTAFSYTGSDQTFVVPVGCPTITVMLWGAGGGGSNPHFSPGHPGEPVSVGRRRGWC